MLPTTKSLTEVKRISPRQLFLYVRTMIPMIQIVLFTFSYDTNDTDDTVGSTQLLYKELSDSVGIIDIIGITNFIFTFIFQS